MSAEAGEAFIGLIFIGIKIFLIYYFCVRHNKVKQQVVIVRECQLLPTVSTHSHQHHTSRRQPSDPEILFELGKNESGEPNRRLYVYTSEAKEFVYEYFWIRENLHQCEKCKRLKAFVTAKLFTDENHEPFVELGAVKHVCVPMHVAEINKDKTKNLMEID